MTSMTDSASSRANSHRRGISAIAAQACQTCRNRKSKCDEQRPTCGLCRRLGMECQYRESLPVKKDKTILHILHSLQTLETKFDNLALGQNSDSTSDLVARTSEIATSSQSPSKTGQPRARMSHYNPSELQQPYQHLTAPHKVMLWPSICNYLANLYPRIASDLQDILQEGTNWFIRLELEKHPITLPCDPGLPSIRLGTSIPDGGYSTRHKFPTITVQQVYEYTEAYFDTFNVICPILCYDAFTNEVLTRLLREGYADGDPHSILALIVFALGQVAIEGVFGEPISTQNGVPSGFRGGTHDRPPGIKLFNEARRRFGLIANMCTLENVQISLLQATYYEAHSRHLDFWHSTVSASMACQVLIRCRKMDWSSQAGDMTKRVYWACVLGEGLYHFDLDLPETGISMLEDEVPLPSFSEYQEPSARQQESKERSSYPYHFLAMITLQRAIARLHGAIYESSLSRAKSSDSYGCPDVSVIRDMEHQLNSWRSLLPSPLQWLDNDIFGFPNYDSTSRRPREPLFSPDQGSVPIDHKHNLDVATAQLRTRFYYARFMMFRPFIYKALHFPELMTTDDTSYCALAIQATCLWPLSMAPPKDKKRLVPHLFAWTQNFMGILLILRMARENTLLRQICDERVSEQNLQQTIALMLDWIRDAKQVDGTAEWSWNIVEPLFAGERTFS